MPVALPDRSTALLSMTLDGSPDMLAPVRLTARETISEPYELEVTAVHAGESPLPPGDVLQKTACVMLRRDGVERRFHGLVREYLPLSQDIRGFHGCTLKIVPRLWALSLANDCRVFQEKTAQEILETLFDEAGISDYAFRITGDNPPLPYRTQFNESALRFAARIMEEAGWFYFFEQSDTTETVVVTDANASLADLGALPAQGALIAGLRPLHAVARGKERTADYNPESPGTEVKGEQATVMKSTGALSPEAFLWPAGTDDPEVAAARARLRMEAQEASASLHTGDGAWIVLSPGHLFEVTGGDRFLPEGTYAVRSVTHEATDESWLNGGAPPAYHNSFQAFPEPVPWRQPLETRRPRMYGLHAAVVIGTESEGNIFTDDLGRVKVRFFWDHRAEAAPDQAIWARVVQPWAGKGWGGQFIPRVGTEVAVGFMDGDPDRPVVLGGLYNGTDSPIFTKADKTKSGFRTKSTDDGGAEEFSEFSFDDKKGEELVFLHAQKDLKMEVENDLNLKVDNCRIVEVKVDDTFTVKGKQTLTVKGDRALTVEQGNYAVAVKTGNYEESVDTGNYKMDVKTGAYDVKVGAGQVTIEAAQGITLKVGSNTLEITPSGITVKGTMLTLKADAKADLVSPMTTVKGDGMLTLKGGILMIN
ncbi:type VI secretion system Vgr family protein [Roseomonas sp. AR75]|uniref:type VI secretion system Vgr family protein n=1 Tax=Roseomonas sp. AR75 TaxID=2562311 RepID=UPI0010C0EDDB|nr:type VI secretion system tip protein TssI/VgrG [Roseomonas sp. AR75]